MQKFKSLITCLIITMLLSSCYIESSKPSETYQDGSYKSLSVMLNYCKGTTVVVGISEIDGRKSYADIDIVVRDSTNKMYTCSTGGDFGLQKGDTIKY